MDERRRGLLPTRTTGPACTAVRGGLTDEEVAIAQRLRAVREAERAVRRALAEATGAARGELESRLAALRAQGRELTAAREAARQRRMVLLGYDTPRG